MKRYLRPLGILSGKAARDAVSAGLALPLAGGPLAYSLMEVIERYSRDRAERRVVPATDSKAGALPICAGATRPVVMGIVNATPDSFSDGGAFLDPGPAIAHARELLAAGAAIIDIGGESTRPGASPVDPDEEIRRVLPVIAGIRASAEAAGAVISVDTRNAATMRRVFDAGAGMINDVSALTHDPEALAVVACSSAKIVLMHMRGEPRTMQAAPFYDDVALDVYDYLDSRIAACEAAGIERSRIVADPGIGFGKTLSHNLQLLDQLTLFHGLGVTLLVGASRKGFIAAVSAGEPADRRLGGSLAAAAAAAAQGVHILRVHDVPETMQALRLASALGDR